MDGSYRQTMALSCGLFSWIRKFELFALGTGCQLKILYNTDKILKKLLLTAGDNCRDSTLLAVCGAVDKLECYRTLHLVNVVYKSIFFVTSL